MLLRWNRDGSGRVSGRARSLWLLATVGLILCLGILALHGVGGQGPASLQGVALANGSTTITLVPSSSTIDGCGSIEVDIWVNNVENLYSGQFLLEFDPGQLEVVDAIPGPGVQVEPLGGLLEPDWILLNDADNTAGTIRYSATHVHPRGPANGSGAVARITLRARGEGPASLVWDTSGPIRTKINSRDADEIPATPVDNSVDTVLPSSPTLSISRLNPTTARLSWTAIAEPGVSQYNLYRDTAPYFTPTDPPYLQTTLLSYDDVGALGDTTTQHYYVVRASCDHDFESLNSNRVGEYDYVLASASVVNYADAAVVLENPAYADTASLASYVGGFVVRVMRYNAATQTWQIYTGNPATNFSLTTGEYVFLVTDNTAPASTALVGNVPDPGTVSFALASGSPPKYNFLSLPLDQGALGSASDVADDVGGGVVRVLKYHAETQTFQIFVPSNPATDFPLAMGEPFQLLLTTGAPGSWP